MYHHRTAHQEIKSLYRNASSGFKSRISELFSRFKEVTKGFGNAYYICLQPAYAFAQINNSLPDSNKKILFDSYFLRNTKNPKGRNYRNRMASQAARSKSPKDDKSRKAKLAATIKYLNKIGKSAEHLRKSAMPWGLEDLIKF